MVSPLPLLALVLACHGPELEPLQAGFAATRLPAPVGVGTVGYLPHGAPPSPTPYAGLYPGTNRIHGHPTLEALVLSRGEGHEVVLLRSDTYGVHQATRQAVVERARAVLGVDLAQTLVWGGTRTQSGPGRLVDGGPTWDLVEDRFLPELHARVVEAAVQVIGAALDDLAPARLGWATADLSASLMDRRCQDLRDHVDGTAPVLAVEREGRVEAVVVVAPMLSTGVGIEALTLSSGIAGATEAWLEEALGAPAHAMTLTSWTADASPSFEHLEHPHGFDAIEEIAQGVAGEVVLALEDLVWEEDPDLEVETRWIPVGREALGYGGDAFPWPHGATLCESATPDTCDELRVLGDLDQGCVPFDADHPAAPQLPVTVGRVGDRLLLTFPGAPGTLLAADLLAALPDEEVVLVGAAQGETLFSLQEDDWWHGGKEASRSLWGPRQGEYLAAEAAAVALAWRDGEDPRWPELGNVAPPDTAATVEPEEAIDPGEILADGPPPVLEQGDTYHIALRGSDPWHGAPLATLETADGDPVLTAGGHPVTSDGWGFEVEVRPVPPYAEVPDAAARSFEWHLALPVSHPTPGLVPGLSGTYRLRVEVPLEDGTAVHRVAPAFQVR